MKWTGLLLLMLVAPAPALADGRLDHRGALGLIVAPGLDYAAVSYAPNEGASDRVSPMLELGTTLGLWSDGNELAVRLRLMKEPAGVGAGLSAGYRAYFGRDTWKTYFQLGLSGDTAPHLALGPSADLGVMVELSPVLGAFFQPGLSVEVGRGLRFGAAAVIGVQGRTYIFE